MHSTFYRGNLRDMERSKWMPARARRAVALVTTCIQNFLIAGMPAGIGGVLFQILEPVAKSASPELGLAAAVAGLVVAVLALLATIALVIGYFTYGAVEALVGAFGFGLCFTLGVLFMTTWDAKHAP